MKTKKILILVDLQKDFVDGALGSEAARAIIPNVVKKIKEFDGKIIVTKDTHDKNYLSTQEGRKLPVPHCIVGTDGWKLNKDVDAAIEEHLARNEAVSYITKETFGHVNWYSTILATCGVQNVGRSNLDIEIIGLCTDICVVSNALIIKATFPEANIHVDASCCAGTSKTAHDAALLTMRSCHVNIENQ